MEPIRQIIETTLNTDIAITREGEQVYVDMLKFWADVAPSFGMIGTMIGLVGMLKNMDDLKGNRRQFCHSAPNDDVGSNNCIHSLQAMGRKTGGLLKNRRPDQSVDCRRSPC